MAHLLCFNDPKPQFEPPKPPEPPLAPPRRINVSPKSALLVENDESLLNFLRRSLRDEGYAVRTAANSEEGLRLYRDWAPFNVVLIDYCVPQRNGDKIDYLEPQTHGIGLAMAIRRVHPSQGIIIAALDYENAGEVPRPPELMHIPLLSDISNLQLRSLLERIEVDRAIEGLTPSELLRLQRFANLLVRGLGRAADGRTGEDLLAEAKLRTLIGAEDTRKGRHWNKDVDFVRHLAEAIRSISDYWRRQLKKKEAYLISESLIHDAEGQEHSPLDTEPSRDILPDQRLIEKDEEDQVLARFKDDPEATQVLQGLLDGLKKIEIMARYSLDEKEYTAAVKRIRVKLLGRRNGGSRSDNYGR
jgi:CheY-like chemotaxis protein